MKIVSIDPGITGSICVSDGTAEEFHATPTINIAGKKKIDAIRLAEIMWNADPDLVVIEQVHAMPGQGVTSMFSFGQAYGIVLGIIGLLQTLKDVNVMFVSPQTWKKHYGLLKGQKEDVLQIVGHHTINKCKNKQMRISFSESLLLNKYGRMKYEHSKINQSLS